MSKTLFFTVASTPTAAEATAIARAQSLLKNGDTLYVRNAAKPTGYGVGREACDFVMGAIPTLYKAVAATRGGSTADDRLTERYDGVLVATTAGKAGNDVTIRFLGDKGLGEGVAIVRAGTDFVIHFEAGVSTVGTVNTAITALGGADDLFGVQTAGTAATVLLGSDTCGPVHLLGGFDAAPDGTLAIVAKPEAFNVFPAAITITAAGATGLAYSIAADVNETTGAVTMSNLTADAKVTWTTADGTKCTVGAHTGIITRAANGGPTAVTATYVVAAAGKSVLDCSTIVPSNQFDTIVEATTAGVGGNVLQIALVSGAVAKAGTSGVVGNVLTLTYLKDSSTVTDMETLITALGGGDDIIGVKTGGTGARVLDKNAGFPAQFLSGGTAAVNVTSSVAVTTTA